MPELPDLSNYIESLKDRILGQPISGIRISSPFILRSVSPTVEEITGKEVKRLFRIGKRIIIELADEHYVAIHLMIAGRFRWYKAGAKIPGKVAIAVVLPRRELPCCPSGGRRGSRGVRSPRRPDGGVQKLVRS